MPVVAWLAAFSSVRSAPLASGLGRTGQSHGHKHSTAPLRNALAHHESVAVDSDGVAKAVVAAVAHGIHVVAQLLHNAPVVGAALVLVHDIHAARRLVVQAIARRAHYGAPDGAVERDVAVVAKLDGLARRAPNRGDGDGRHVGVATRRRLAVEENGLSAVQLRGHGPAVIAAPGVRGDGHGMAQERIRPRRAVSRSNLVVDLAKLVCAAGVAVVEVHGSRVLLRHRSRERRTHHDNVAGHGDRVAWES